MSPQDGVGDKAFPALGAAKRLLARVRSLVDDQVGVLDEGLPTHGAGERTLTCVNALVGDELRVVQKTFAALRAGIRLLPSVDFTVFDELGIGLKALSTTTATVGFIVIGSFGGRGILGYALTRSRGRFFNASRNLLDLTAVQAWGMFVSREGDLLSRSR